MSQAYIFPGQGAQFPGMGKALYEKSSRARTLFEQANDILGFRISDVMFEGTAEDLKATRVTQPAVFLHSVVSFFNLPDPKPAMAAGHSLGEFSALVAVGGLSFEDGLRLVAKRAEAMQAACEGTPSTMAAVLGLDDEKVESVLAEITDEVVVPANYNCPGQLVISGSLAGVEKARLALLEAGAKRVLLLQVGGAFHSPLMEPARQALKSAIENTRFSKPLWPVYQNVDALPYLDPDAIRMNLVNQLTAPVRWTQIVENMLSDGATRFTECGPGTVLQGLVRKVDRSVETDGVGE